MEDNVLVGCEIICIGVDNPMCDLTVCPLPKEEAEKCEGYRQYNAGMKEIIDWIKTHKSKNTPPITFDTHGVEFCILIKNAEWQAFLKERGLK